MATQFQNIVLGISIPMLFLFFISPTFANDQTKPRAPRTTTTLKSSEKDDDTSKVVTEFCNQRETTEDRTFCSTVLRLNPVSANAKDHIALLKIAIDLAVSNAKRTRDFMETLYKDEGTIPSLKPVLQDCISAYDGSIRQLQSIIKELQDDPPMANFDARMANQELEHCQNSFSTSKLNQDQLVSRHKIAIAYGKLCEDIAKKL